MITDEFKEACKKYNTPKECVTCMTKGGATKDDNPGKPFIQYYCPKCYELFCYVEGGKDEDS